MENRIFVSIFLNYNASYFKFRAFDFFVIIIKVYSDGTVYFEPYTFLYRIKTIYVARSVL